MYWWADGYVPKRAAEVLAGHPKVKRADKKGDDKEDKDGAVFDRHPLVVQQFVGSGRSKKTPLDLIMKYTYEGNRTLNGKTEAVITIAGEVENRKTSKYEGASSRPKMRVIGQGNFDVAAGFFSKLKVAIRADGETGSCRKTGSIRSTPRPSASLPKLVIHCGAL